MAIPYNQRRPSELPEVVEQNYPESFAYVKEGYRHEPGEQPPLYLAYDQTQKEFVDDHLNSPETYYGYRGYGGYGNNHDVVTPVTATTSEHSADLESPKGPKEAEPAPPMICGLQRKTAIWLMLLACLVIAAAVGGGVGGGIAAAGRNSGSSNSGQAGTTSTVTSSTIQPTSTTTTAPTPQQTSFLNNQSMPFAYQAYETPEYGGQVTPIFRDAGVYDLGFNCTSYVWTPNGTDCCSTMCRKNITWTGFWCQARRQPNSTRPFDHLIITCGGLSEDRSKNLCPWGEQS